jgi:methylmalonyl-CoA mutase
VKQFNPTDAKSLALRTHCQTSGWSLTEQDPFNNVARTCIEASAAAFGNSLCIPMHWTKQSYLLTSRLELREYTDLFTGRNKITKTVDPWAGSYYVERLTHELLTMRETY